MRLPKMLSHAADAPLLLVAGNRIEAWRLVPLLRALRNSRDGGGALLVDAGRGDEVGAALRELGMAADLRLGSHSRLPALTFSLHRLVRRISPSMIVAGGGSPGALACGLAAKSLATPSTVLDCAVDGTPLWRWRALSMLFTWILTGSEVPSPRARSRRLGDPLFDLYREQAAATASNGAQRSDLVVWDERTLDDPLACMRRLSATQFEWIDAPAGVARSGLRRLGAVPHWRRLALIRRATVIVTDQRLTAFQARWLARPVVWTGADAAPAGCLQSSPEELPRTIAQALNGALAPLPLLEDGRAAPRLAAALRERVESRAFAGWLTQFRTRA